jgi:hypothetical protein
LTSPRAPPGRISGRCGLAEKMEQKEIDKSPPVYRIKKDILILLQDLPFRFYYNHIINISNSKWPHFFDWHYIFKVIRKPFSSLSVNGHNPIGIRLLDNLTDILP